MNHSFSLLFVHWFSFSFIWEKARHFKFNYFWRMLTTVQEGTARYLLSFILPFRASALKLKVQHLRLVTFYCASNQRFVSLLIWIGVLNSLLTSKGIFVFLIYLVIILIFFFYCLFLLNASVPILTSRTKRGQNRNHYLLRNTSR